MPSFIPKRVAAEIRRDITDTAGIVCYEHELPIYQAIHGEEAVKVLDAKAAEVNVIQPKEPIDTVAEFARLEQAFGFHPEINVTFAEYVYGRRGVNFASAVGAKESRAA